MKKRKLGSDLEVSSVGLGCMGMSDFYLASDGRFEAHRGGFSEGGAGWFALSGSINGKCKSLVVMQVIKARQRIEQVDNQIPASLRKKTGLIYE